MTANNNNNLIIRHGRKFTRLNVRRMSHSPGIVNQTPRSIRSLHYCGHFLFFSSRILIQCFILADNFFFKIRKF